MKKTETSQGSSLLASTNNSSFTNKHSTPTNGITNRFEQNKSQFFTVCNHQDGQEAEYMNRLTKTTYQVNLGIKKTSLALTDPIFLIID
jgi:hypothetical protein